MSIFSFFTKQTGQQSAPALESETTSKEIANLPEIKKEDFVDDSEPEPESIYVTIKYGTGMPIDAIYAYIKDDYEQMGYDDAMCNADIQYKESKKEIIINKLKVLFEQVRLRYKGDIRDIEVYIDTVEAQGITSTASTLKARKETFNEHLRKIDEMEESLDKGEKKMLNMVASYERGFLKGVSAKSESFIKKQ